MKVSFLFGPILIILICFHAYVLLTQDTIGNSPKLVSLTESVAFKLLKGEVRDEDVHGVGFIPNLLYLGCL